jgi:excisionase family DNA binding protein
MGRGSLLSNTTAKPLVRAGVVAEYLSCCEAHVLRLARAGKIPGRKISNGSRVYWRFDLDEVLRFLKARSASGGK